MLTQNRFATLSEDAVPIPSASTLSTVPARTTGGLTTTSTHTKTVSSAKKSPHVPTGKKGGVKVITASDTDQYLFRKSVYEQELEARHKAEQERKKAELQLQLRRCHFYQLPAPHLNKSTSMDTEKKKGCGAFKSGEHGPYCEECWLDAVSPNICITSKCKNPCSLSWEKPGIPYRKCFLCRYPNETTRQDIVINGTRRAFPELH